METNQYSKNQAARDLHNDVFPCVTSGKVPGLPPQVNLTDRSWPFIGSFAVHAVLVAMISCPVFQYPIFTSSQSPAVFWFSPFSLPDNSEEPESPLPGPLVAFAAQQEASVNEPIQQSPDNTGNPVQADYQENVPEPPVDIAEPELTIATPAPVKKTVEAAKLPKPPPDTPRRPTPVPTPKPTPPAPAPVQVKNVTSPLKAEPESPRALPAMIKVMESRSSDNEMSPQNEDARISRQIIEQSQLATEKLRREQLVREQELRVSHEKIELERAAVEKARQKQQAAEKLRRAQELRAIQDRLDLERAAAEKAQLKKLASDNELLKRKNLEVALHKQEMERVARGKAEQDLAVVSARQNKPAPQQYKKPPEVKSPVKPAEKAMSVSLPLIKGDLKLVIAGAIQPDTMITFTDFARSRRDRPFSRAESRRNTKIVPLIANTRDTVREVVIFQANQGVYTITAEPARETASITLSLKLYEGTSKAVTRELGKHTVSRKKVLLKILMPDGILWDDDAAFSGNMEDSEGVTKFNTESGLMWKEYNE